MKLKPISDLAKPPLPPKEALQQALKDNKSTLKSLPKNDSFKEAVLMEAELRFHSYLNFIKKNVEEVRLERVERGLSCNDLPKDDNDDEGEGEGDKIVESKEESKEMDVHPSESKEDESKEEEVKS